MKELIRMARALSDSNRLRIIKLLEKRTMCVCELAAVIGIAQPSVSRHLKKLKAAGLVCDKQSGFWTDYYVCSPGARQPAALLRQILGFLEHEPQVRTDRRAARTIDRLRLCCSKRNNQ